MSSVCSSFLLQNSPARVRLPTGQWGRGVKRGCWSTHVSAVVISKKALLTLRANNSVPSGAFSCMWWWEATPSLSSIICELPVCWLTGRSETCKMCALLGASTLCSHCSIHRALKCLTAVEHLHRAANAAALYRGHGPMTEAEQVFLQFTSWDRRMNNMRWLSSYVSGPKLAKGSKVDPWPFSPLSGLFQD